MDQAIVKQICSVFDEWFYKALRNGSVGYNNRTAANFLHHMYGNYSQINSTMIIESENKISQPFNPAAPIEDLFQQISNRQDLTIAAGVPYSKNQ
eukprot:8765019-Ditylum_brightwellii.AAC.1